MCVQVAKTVVAVIVFVARMLEAQMVAGIVAEMVAAVVAAVVAVVVVVVAAVINTKHVICNASCLVLFRNMSLRRSADWFLYCNS